MCACGEALYVEICLHTNHHVIHKDAYTTYVSENITHCPCMKIDDMTTVYK